MTFARSFQPLIKLGWQLAAFNRRSSVAVRAAATAAATAIAAAAA